MTGIIVRSFNPYTLLFSNRHLPEIAMPMPIPTGEASENTMTDATKYLTVIPWDWARFKPSEKAMIPLWTITAMKIWNTNKADILQFIILATTALRASAASSESEGTIKIHILTLVYRS